MTSVSLTFPIRPDQLTALRRAVEQADRQARAHGLNGCQLTRGQAEFMEWPDINGVPIGTVPCEDATVTLPLLHFQGWTVIAELEHEPEAGTTVTVLPPYVDEPVDVSPRCDACGESEGTLTSYLLRHDDGQTMQLGRTCTEPYAGFPAAVLAALWRLVRWCLAVEPYEAGTVPPGMRVDLGLVLEYAAALTTAAGYAKRGGDSPLTTADQVRALLLGSTDRDVVRQLHRHLRAAGDVSALAESVREWCRESTNDPSDYRRKLARVAQEDTADPKELGLLVSAVPIYMREAQRELRAGDRTSITATITEVSPLSSEWGQRRLIRFVDGAGCLYAWESMTKPFPKAGDQLRLTGRVVRTGARDGKVETYLSRCRVMPAAAS
ncbi:hypothetical protein [Streptomyces phaeochromogenes]